MSILASRKQTGTSEKKPAAAAGLIKPRMAAAQDSRTPSPGENPDKGKSDEKNVSSGGDKSDEKAAASAKTVAALDRRAVDKDLPSGKKADAPVKPLRQVSDDALPAKKESVQSEPKPKPDSGKQEPAPSGDKAKATDDIAFKKHDHSKYTSAIRGKAIDQVNKEKDVALARLCRDSTTEEWSLTLYRKRQQTYSFVSYVWDEIDEKWEQAFVSDQRPISGWKQHLDFSSSGKDCVGLKGTPP